MKQKFKNKDFNAAYLLWLRMSHQDTIKLMGSSSGSNRDDAFKRGFLGMPCPYQKNWMLYPIYMAGKNWRTVNKVMCPDCEKALKLTSSQDTDWYGKLVYYKCNSCKEEFVSERGRELEIAAP